MFLSKIIVGKPVQIPLSEAHLAAWCVRPTALLEKRPRQDTMIVISSFDQHSTSTRSFNRRPSRITLVHVPPVKIPFLKNFILLAIIYVHKFFFEFSHQSVRNTILDNLRPFEAV